MFHYGAGLVYHLEELQDPSEGNEAWGRVPPFLSTTSIRHQLMHGVFDHCITGSPPAAGSLAVSFTCDHEPIIRY